MTTSSEREGPAPPVPPRLVDLRRDALAGPLPQEALTMLSDVDPGLDVTALVRIRQRLLCEPSR